MERYNRSIEIAPNFIGVHFWKSKVHAWFCDYDAAIKEAERTIELDKSLDCLLNLAWGLRGCSKK